MLMMFANNNYDNVNGGLVFFTTSCGVHSKYYCVYFSAVDSILHPMVKQSTD